MVEQTSRCGAELEEERIPMKLQAGNAACKWASARVTRQNTLAMVGENILKLEQLFTAGAEKTTSTMSRSRTLSLPSPARALAVRCDTSQSETGHLQEHSLLLGFHSGEIAALPSHALLSDQPNTRRPLQLAYLCAARADAACTALSWCLPQNRCFAAGFSDGSVHLVGPMRYAPLSCAGSSRDAPKAPSKCLQHSRRSLISDLAWHPLGGAVAIARRDGSVNVLQVHEANCNGTPSPEKANNDGVADGTEYPAAEVNAALGERQQHASGDHTNSAMCDSDVNSVAFTYDDGKSTRTEECGFESYYGAMLCTAWSHDGNLLASGGECDQAELFVPHINAVVAWLNGHLSYVSCLAFCPALYKQQKPPIGKTLNGVTQSQSQCNGDASGTNAGFSNSHFRCSSVGSGSSSNGSSRSTSEERKLDVYRLVGGGHDGQVLIWDIPIAPDVFMCKRGAKGIRPPVRKGQVPMLKPKCSIDAHSSPITSLQILQDRLLTVSCFGNVRVWCLYSGPFNERCAMDSDNVNMKAGS